MNRIDSDIEYVLMPEDMIKRRVKEATGVDIITPVYYSGEYGYNVDKLMDLIIDNIPKQRRDLITQ